MTNQSQPQSERLEEIRRRRNALHLCHGDWPCQNVHNNAEMEFQQHVLEDIDYLLSLLQQAATSERCGECGHERRYFNASLGYCTATVKLDNYDAEKDCEHKCVYPATGAPTEPQFVPDWRWYDTYLRATGYENLANRMRAEFKPVATTSAAEGEQREATITIPAQWIINSHHRVNDVDYACGDCCRDRDDSTVVDGFVCVYHEALKAIKAATPPAVEPQEIPSTMRGGEALDNPAVQAEFSDGSGRWDIPRLADTVVELRTELAAAQKERDDARASAIRGAVEALQAVQNENELEDGGFFEAGFIAARTKSIDALIALQSLAEQKEGEDGKVSGR